MYELRGRSVNGLRIPVLHITRGVKRKRKLLKPMIKLMANIHGNEVVGR
jgi:hypothetical protein